MALIKSSFSLARLAFLNFLRHPKNPQSLAKGVTAPLRVRGVAYNQFSTSAALLAKSKAAQDDATELKYEGMSTTVCQGANYYTHGSDPELKDDSEYPDWLWTLLDPPAEDSKTYHRQQKKAKARLRNKLMKHKE
ncbi:PREDICTED: 54S ribosomal protein L37, mitochondrial-like [Amphimedon queenslandica]|uniref:Large ribosomal subunit protein mL54 n=1 Tax=Amphimedon queenslandica TaxID=400682 RepID=A0A1X7UP20_AMPQE|nr:PREDICTED: 54S ribosomal protein L37, mitochondrial-like [Amphimedon queenslandica]|eukprot:XP_003387208.1 PREDICTED: 54S ribosomal protein L37, mitochondrial-like [Amphimedon queenslandica]